MYIFPCICAHIYHNICNMCLYDRYLQENAKTENIYKIHVPLIFIEICCF